MPKWIFVTGGVMSGLGKGIVTASIARLLMMTGLKVSAVKIDPYLNVDAGTLNPIAHGEVFVCDDGSECDMDIGNYERFLDKGLKRYHNITSGQVYQQVIKDERKGNYLGQCVQIIPHLTNEIKRRIRLFAEIDDADCVVIECGGTVGDIESLPFLEAFRQMRLEEDSYDTLFIHVTLVPVLDVVGEQKTKPTQHSVQELRRIGIQPDIIVARSEKPLTKEAKNKIALFTSVDLKSVISNPDTESVYSVPENLASEGIVSTICEKLQLGNKEIHWGDWKEISQSFIGNKEEVRIAMVGKYTALSDSYVSINHALAHAGAQQGLKIKVRWVDAEEFEDREGSLDELKEYHGVLVPGGFGQRGSEGKIIVANYCREKGIPYLGLCFGFQLALVSFARYVCGLKGANSVELDPNTLYPVVDLLPEQRDVKDLGATMRLGGYDIHLVEGTLAYRIYCKKVIRGRHRHRYEFNQNYREIFERKGMVFSGFSDEGKRVEIMEIPNHPFYLATQYHAEFVSRPGRAEPIFLGFLEAALRRRHEARDYSPLMKKL
ncbi:MAG: CTP synthase [archaeon]|nr:CTP synthase [archaeon]MCP8306826.1 CTP synthase [archaeon]